MGRFLSGILLPLLLLTAAVLDRSLVSLADLIASLVILFTAPKIGFRRRRRYLVSCYVITFSVLAILLHSIFHIILAIEGDHWSMGDAQWAKLMGFIRDQSGRSPSVIYFLVIKLSAALIALMEIYESNIFLDSSYGSCLRDLVSSFEQIGRTEEKETVEGPKAKETARREEEDGKKREEKSKKYLAIVVVRSRRSLEE